MVKNWQIILSLEPTNAYRDFICSRLVVVHGLAGDGTTMEIPGCFETIINLVRYSNLVSFMPARICQPVESAQSSPTRHFWSLHRFCRRYLGSYALKLRLRLFENKEIRSAEITLHLLLSHLKCLSISFFFCCITGCILFFCCCSCTTI